MATREIGSWTAFLMMAFAVVGLLAAFATYAAQIPLDRELARETALDQALAAERAGGMFGLGDTGPRGGPAGGGPLGPTRLGLAARGHRPDKIGSTEASLQAERVRMRAAFQAEADDVGFRLRIVIAAFTVTGALFGAFVLAIVRRG